MFRTFLFLVIILIASSLRAQISDNLEHHKELWIGVGGGYLKNTIDFTPSVNIKSLGGSFYGFSLRYFDTHLVGLQAELNYSQGGWSEDIDDSFASLYTRELTFIETLIMTQLSIGKKAFQPMIQAGPYLSFPIQQNEIIPSELDSISQPERSYYGQELPFRINFGLQMGVGFNLELGRALFQASARYLLGFNDLIKTGSTTAVISRRKGIGGSLHIMYSLQ